VMKIVTFAKPKIVTTNAKMKTLKIIFVTFLSLTSSIILGQQDFKIDSKKIDSTGQIIWTTLNEPTNTKYHIEQFRWNKWVKVGHLDGKGKEKNEYKLNVTFHGGINKFRILAGEIILDSISFKAPLTDCCEGWITKIDKEIILDSVRSYEIYDSNGILKIKGTARKIDISKLDRGAYYFNSENNWTEFIKK
jgi:hypothetical protein